MSGFHLNVSSALHIQPFLIFAVIYSPIYDMMQTRSCHIGPALISFYQLVLEQ